MEDNADNVLGGKVIVVVVAAGGVCSLEGGSGEAGTAPSGRGVVAGAAGGTT